MVASYGLTRFCHWCKSKIKPWSKSAPAWCCEDYRDSVRLAIEIYLRPKGN